MHCVLLFGARGEKQLDIAAKRDFLVDCEFLSVPNIIGVTPGIFRNNFRCAGFRAVYSIWHVLPEMYTHVHGSCFTRAVTRLWLLTFK